MDTAVPNHYYTYVSGSFIPVVCVYDVGDLYPLHSGGKGLAHSNRADGLGVHGRAGVLKCSREGW